MRQRSIRARRLTRAMPFALALALALVIAGPSMAGKVSWLDEVVQEVLIEARAGGKSAVDQGATATRSAGRLFAREADHPGSFQGLIPRAKAWRTWASAAFLREYLAVAKSAPFLPKDPAHVAALLDAQLLDKALYELMYELNNRPAWVRIPLAAILALPLR